VGGVWRRCGMAVFGYVETEGGNLEVGSGAWCMLVWWFGGSARIISCHIVSSCTFVARGGGIKRYRSQALRLVSIILQVHIANSTSPLLSCMLLSSSSSSSSSSPHSSHPVSYIQPS
jgi:hypothetical protein